MKPIHIAAATIGSAIVFYNFVVYSFFSIQLGQAFFPAEDGSLSLMMSLATFGVGFATRPIGAYVIGNYSDRKGRRSAMVLCSVMIGCAAAGMAVIPSYSQLGIAAPILAVVMRLVQGFALGGEVGSNTAFLSEAASPNSRGFAVSWQSASQNLALIAAGLVGTLCSSVLPENGLGNYGWRVALILGAVAVPFGLWLRTNIPETLHQDSDPVPALPRPRLSRSLVHWRIFGLGLVALSAGTIGHYILTYIVIFGQSNLGLSARVGFIAETSGYALGIPVSLLGGWLSDRYGRRPITLLGNGVFLGLIYPTFAWIISSRSEFSLILGMTTLIGAANFIWGAFYAGLAESVPAAIRSSSVGILYSIAIAAFGGTTQLATAWLIQVSGSVMAPAWYMIGATVLGHIALWLMEETAPVRRGIASENGL